MVTGAVVLMRDISELRRRDRLLLSKDATIREIHHRVKNNLQTISSLLRLQGRRLSSPEAKAAVEESVRRIRSIALVHEILSHEAGDDVPFIEIVRPLVRMVEEALLSPEHPVDIKITGDAGKLPATIATPLAVVLNELLQNVVDHAYPAAADLDSGHVLLELDNDEAELRVRVTDDGAGLPEGFSLEGSTGLGLSIVRTLVTTELERHHRPGPRRRAARPARDHGRPTGAPRRRRCRPRAWTRNGLPSWEAGSAGRRLRGEPARPVREGPLRPRPGAWRPSTGGAACGAPPRRCRPRRRSPGWW